MKTGEGYCMAVDHFMHQLASKRRIPPNQYKELVRTGELPDARGRYHVIPQQDV